MNEPPVNRLTPAQINTELAKERNRAAAERTLMAWIRTCLALISFGFGIDQIVQALHQTQLGQNFDIDITARIVGLSFIALGIYAMFAATVEHRKELRHIQRDDYLYVSRRSLAVTVATALVLIGIFAFLAILIEATYPIV